MNRHPLVRYLPCAFVALLVFAQPAAAQSDPRDAEDRPALQLGPVEFRPRLAFKDIGVDDNVFNEAANPKRDFTATISPDLEIATRPGRLKLAYTTATDLVYFHKYKTEQSRNSTLGGRAELDLAWLKPFASFSLADTRARLNSEIDARAHHHPRSYTVGTTVKIASRTSVGVLRRHTTDSYDEGLQFRGEDLARAFDSTVRTYESSINVELTPFTTFSIVGGKDEQRFDRAPERDADSFRIAPTLTFSPLGLVSGSASFGYRHFNGLDPTLPDYSGFVSTGTIGILFYDQYKLDTTFTRDVRYSYERLMPYYVVGGVRATLAAQMFGPLDARFLGGRESMSYRSLAGGTVPGSDRLVLYGGGVGWRMGPRVRAAIDAEFWHRTSERDATRAFRNRRLVALLTWGALNR